MKTIVLSVLCVLLIGALQAQIDQKQMDRDLEISKNVLATLLKEEGNRMISEHRIEANYIDDFGVIIKIPKDIMHFNFSGFRIANGSDAIMLKNGGTAYSFSLQDAEKQLHEAEENLREAESRIEVIVESDDENENKASKDIAKEKDKDKDKDKKVVEEKIVVPGPSGWKNTQKDMEAEREEIKSIIITFLADYADLIKQLKPEDKIMVKRDTRDESFIYIPEIDENGTHVKSSSNGGMSITALKKDITAYKTGKINKDEFVKKLDINLDKENKRIADLEIFSNVLKQYFSPEFSKSFFTYEKPPYDRIDGVGAIFHVRTHSALGESDFHNLPSYRQGNTDNKKDNEKIEPLYPVFINDLKSFIIDYGRTIRALQEDEQLILRVDIANCASCDIPGSVEASVKMSVLADYDKQKITREKAISQINIKETR